MPSLKGRFFNYYKKFCAKQKGLFINFFSAYLIYYYLNEKKIFFINKKYLSL
jgi:hypothetical protein